MTVRRLNRRDYRNTIRDLLGVDFAVSKLFPADGSGGEGFNTNGETLFLPPLLMERYLEAAQQILDRAILSPPLDKEFNAEHMTPPVEVALDEPRQVKAGEKISAMVTVYRADNYNVAVNLRRARTASATFTVKVDGIEVAEHTLRLRKVSRRPVCLISFGRRCRTPGV